MNKNLFFLLVFSALLNFTPAQNYSLSFDGIDDYVGTMSEVIIAGNMPFTIECWVKIESVSSVIPIINKAGFDGSNWVYNLYADEFPSGLKYGFGIYTGEPPPYVYGILLLNQWQHIAGVRSTNGYLYLFVDGNKTDSLFVGTDPLLFSTSELKFGKYFSSEYYLEGKLTNIRISNIDRYINNFIPTINYQVDQYTVGLWNMSEGSGSTLHDISGNDINGSIFGASWSNDFPSTALYINITSPNGDEEWLVGSTQDITWSSSNISNVKIEYSTDSGVSWITIIDSTSSSGNYSWTIPNTASNNCKVRISDLANLSIYDESDNVFSIIQPSVTVISPNGGELWSVGSNQTITWASNNISDVKIEYTTDSGSTWITIISSTPSDGNHAWTIPNTPSNNCKVKISDVANPSTNDESDNSFSIIQPAISVTTPNGSESWLVGSTQDITWTSSNVSNVKIEYSTDSGVSWITIIDSTSSSGNYSWTIPNTPSNNCKVKISDVTNLSIYDESDSVFSIIQPSVTVISPNGGEGWQIGTVQNIIWSSSSVDNVKIEYTTNNGSSWNTIIGSTLSDGTYEWTIPNTPSEQCKVKISDTANPDIFDESNSTFSIISSVLFALIQADSIWIDTDYDGLELGLVDGSGSYFSGGTITNYEWYVNNEFITNGVTPTLELTTGTSIVKLIVYTNTGLSASDSIYISVYSAKLSTGGAILSGVSQFENSFYITSMDNGVYRIDSTGTILQSYLTGGSIQSSLCISAQTSWMYVGSSDTRLYCFDTNLNSLWDKGLGGVVNNAASVNYNGEIVYAGANDTNTNLGFLKSLVAANGDPKWNFQADGTILSSPVVMEIVDSNNVVLRTIIYFGTSKGTVYAIDDLGDSYNLFWSETTNPDSAFVSSPAISEEGMLYIGSKNGYLYRFNWDGNYQSGWRKYTGGSIVSSPIIDENNIVYISSASGYVYGFDKDFTFNSDPVKIFYQNVGINGTAGIGPGGSLLVGCDNGSFFSLDKNVSGTDMPINWYFQASSSILAPTLITDNGIVYIGATNGDVFIMRDLNLGNKTLTLSNYEWPTFKGNNQRSKVVRLISGVSAVEDKESIILSYELYQNYPNPFNPQTTIKYQIPELSLVALKVFDVLGSEVVTLVNEEKQTGTYEVEFDATGLPSGVYFYQIKAGNYIETKKMLLLQ